MLGISIGVALWLQSFSLFRILCGGGGVSSLPPRSDRVNIRLGFAVGRGNKDTWRSQFHFAGMFGSCLVWRFVLSDGLSAAALDLERLGLVLPFVSQAESSQLLGCLVSHADVFPKRRFLHGTRPPPPY